MANFLFPIYEGISRTVAVTLLLVVGTSARTSWAATVDLPSTDWTPIDYVTTLPDPNHDQQTGQQEGDIVGNAINPALLTYFDAASPASLTDGVLYYRLRLGGEENPPGYSRAAFVGIDANADGKIDGFIGVDNSGSGDTIGIWDAGTGANVSPSTTTIASLPYKTYGLTSTNYDWRPVAVGDGGNTLDLDGGTSGIDHYLSFGVLFADVVSYFNTVKAMAVNQNSPFSYVFATATQANSLNQDIGAVNSGVNSSVTWTALGAVSKSYSAGGMPVVPEPSAAWLLAGAVGLGWSRRRKQ